MKKYFEGDSLFAISCNFTMCSWFRPPRTTKGGHEQRAQELLVNKMERSRDIRIGNEVTGSTKNSEGESLKEEVQISGNE